MPADSEFSAIPERSLVPRNLIVIVADTLRHPRYFDGGGVAASMPFLESVQREATSLDRLIASSSWTCPSHASLLTGVDPWNTHFYLSKIRHSTPDIPSLADRWRERGGRSMAFSENFLVAPELGTAPGYDAYNPGLFARMAGKIQQGVTTLGYERVLHRVERRRLQPGAGTSARTAARAVEFLGTGIYQTINSMRSGVALNGALRRSLRDRRDRQPLHLFLNFGEAHEPYFSGGPTGAGSGDIGRIPSINFARHTDYLAPAGEGPRFLAAYMRSVRILDDHLRMAFETFRRAGLLENAVVLFTSDHGQSLGEHGFYGHGHYLYDELIRIPGFLLEYRDSAPVKIPPVATDWVDLRHLFDLLVSAAPDGSPLDPTKVLNESLGRRGPAASFWEGPLPRPPKGFFHSPPRSELYRLLRVQRGDSAATLTDGLDGVPMTTLPEEGGATSDPELVDLGRRYLAATTNDAAAPAALDSQVDARLKSWGYD